MENQLPHFALFLFFATLTSVVTRAKGWSNILPLIMVGALIGLTPWSSQSVSPGLAMMFLVAPLVFGDGITSSFRELRKNALNLILLAVIPVITSTLAVGAVGHWATGMTWALAFAIGAVLSPTDTVALTSVTRSVPMPRDIKSIIEGEALLNDASALTALHLSISLLLAGQLSGSDILLMFTQSNLIGIGIGLSAGWLVARSLRITRDDLAMNCLTVIVPFVVYTLADYFEGSGILAIVCAALSIGITQQQLNAFTGRHHFMAIWEHSAFILQSIAFLLVGVELTMIMHRLPDDEWMQLPLLASGILVTLIVMRFITLFALRAVLLALRPHVELPWKGTALVSWFGVRGPVSAMAALTIPLTLADGTALPQRDLAIAAAFLVILMTVVLSYTIKPLIKRLNFAEEEDLKRHEVALWEHVTTRVLDQVEKWIEDFDSRSGLDPSEIALLDFTRKEYRYRQSRYRDYLNPDSGKEPANQPADDKTSDEHLHVMDFMGSRMMLRLIEMHRDVLIHTDWPDVIPDEVIRKAMKLTDIQLHWLSISLWSSYETSTRTPLITQWRP
jgi:CPA1 family monovalent cation:H+ antiporter